MVNFMFVLMMIILVPGTVRCLTFTPIGTIDDKNSFECNTNVSFVCQTQNGQDIIILELNNTQLVNCVTRCFVNTPLLGKYIVTHNFDEGTIRLDIPTITNADASNEFICRGDFTSISIKPIIKVFPVKSLTELIINEMNGTNVVEIKALTGCVLLQNNLTFVWRKTRYFNGTTLKPLSTEGFIIKTTVSAKDGQCIPSDHCGGEAHSSTLEFTEETNGGVDYYITCTIVINENVTRNTSQTYTIISERKFTLKEETVNDLTLHSGGCFFETGCTIGVAIAISIVIILFAVVTMSVMMRKRKSVDDCPDSPTSLRLISRTETFATFTWTPGRNSEGQNKFRLCYKIQGDNTSTFEEIKVKGTIKTIKDLQPGCMYQCYVYAMIGNGKSNNSTRTYFTTLGLPDDPVDFHLVEDTLTETIAEFRWKPGKYRKYKQSFVISYWLKDDKENITPVTVNDTQQKTISYLVKNLQEGQQYVFCIVARNEIGNSNISETVFVQTKGLPQDPVDFHLVAERLTETTAEFCWKPGLYRKYKQIFVISYWLKGDEENITNESVDDTHQNTLSYLVKNVQPGNEYGFCIVAQNEIGKSSISESVFVQTKGLPDEPRNFRLVDDLLTETTATFMWEPGEYRKYQQTFVISYCMQHDEKHTHGEEVADEIENYCTHTVSGLKEGKQYEFEMRSKNRIGVSNRCTKLLLETKDEVMETETA